MEVKFFLELVFTFYSLSELEWKKVRYLTKIFQHSCQKCIRRVQSVVLRINVFCEKNFQFHCVLWLNNTLLLRRFFFGIYGEKVLASVVRTEFWVVGALTWEFFCWFILNFAFGTFRKQFSTFWRTFLN